MTTGKTPRSLMIADFVDPLLKILGIGGALIYGVLFIAYQRYYTSVGVRPEDVGVNSGFVLIRSVGFLILTLGIGCIVLLFWWILTGFAPGRITVGDILRFLASGALGIVLVGYLFVAFDDVPVIAYFLVYLVLIGVTGLSAALHESHRLVSLAIIVTMGSVVTLVVPAVATVLRAQHLGEELSRAQTVDTYEILSLPLLDVSAVKVSVAWIGPAAEKPPVFGSQSAIDGVLIGKTSDSVLLRANINERFSTIELPSARVAIVT